MERLLHRMGGMSAVIRSGGVRGHLASLSLAILCVAAVACGEVFVDFPGEGGGGQGASAGNGGNGASGGGRNCDCEVGADVPVCGVDGITYDAACGEACVPVAIACQGGCPCNQDRCAELEIEYQSAIERAKACSPLLPVVQCEVEVGNHLACPCTTRVDQSNVGAIEDLDNLREEWDMLACAANIGCPDEECPTVSGGECTAAAGDAGECKDLFAN